MKRRSATNATHETAIAEAFELAHDRLAAALREALKQEVAAAPLRRLLGEVTRQLQIEEELLFERFEEGCGLKEEGPTVLLRREHREILRRLETLATALETERACDPPADIRALLALLEDHRRREATALFPTCDRLLDGSEREKALCALGENTRLSQHGPAPTQTDPDENPR